nr:DUF4172 domain-containing protein [Hyphomonas sp. Mor2]
MPFIWQTDAWPNLTFDAAMLQQTFERVIGKAGELAGLRAGFSGTDQTDTFIQEVSAETIHSFGIEGETLDPASVTQSLIASLVERDRSAAAGLYRNVANVMLDAKDVSRPLTVDRLNGWHAQLFERARFMRDIGQLRTEEMQVVTTRRGEVQHVHLDAPPPNHLAEEMASFVAWIAATKPDPSNAVHIATPARAALGHLWFETIHPYSDGNGRIGRAVADFIAAEQPLFQRAPFSLSRAIQENKAGYYEALQTAQSAPVINDQIDVTSFVDWFANAMARGIDLATAEARFIMRRNRFFERNREHLNERQSKALQRLFQEGAGRLEQGLSSKPYQRITGASPATATRDLADLAAKGILRRSEVGGRSTSFEILIDEQS